jgi:hypothetical protein
MIGHDRGPSLMRAVMQKLVSLETGAAAAAR